MGCTSLEQIGHCWLCMTLLPFLHLTALPFRSAHEAGDGLLQRLDSIGSLLGCPTRARVGCRFTQTTPHISRTYMRFYRKKHPHTCGVDLHTRTMFLCRAGSPTSAGKRGYFRPRTCPLKEGHRSGQDRKRQGRCLPNSLPPQVRHAASELRLPKIVNFFYKIFLKRLPRS